MMYQNLKMCNIIFRIKWKFRIWYSLSILNIISIYKSCDWIYFFHGMVIEIVLNNKIQIFFVSNQFIFLKKDFFFLYIIGKDLNLILSFEQNCNKISKIKNDVFWNGLNKMHNSSLSQQVGWHGSKGVDFHPWDSKINSHKWHGLWPTPKCWLNLIPTYITNIG